MQEQKVYPFLLFDGTATEAMRLYEEAFGAEVLSELHYGPGSGAEGKVMHAIFRLKGEMVMCADDLMQSGHRFSPALSLFVSCESSDEIERAVELLAQDGTVMMPLGPLKELGQFAWVEDRFGVSWQLNVPPAEQDDENH